MATATKSKPASAKAPPVWKQPEMFAGKAEPLVPKDAWRLESPPVGLGTLAPDVYRAWRVLFVKGPLNSEDLFAELRIAYDWDVMRIPRVVQKLANCGYVTVGTGGLLTARTDAP
jgi:hypothetical protein